MLWIKAFHLIAVVCWFAALFYLPRLFVYHAMSDDRVSRDRFKVMERKLYRGIGTPSMLATVVLGFWLVAGHWAYYQASAWFWAKMVLVNLLVIYHFICGYYVKQFRDERCQKSHVYFRWFNEFPVLPLVLIVILAVVKPF
jgi:protoporphyrinogen IX oxidase